MGGRVRTVLVGATAIAVLVSCGRGSSVASTSTKAGWTARHGADIAALNADLQTAQDTLSSLQRDDILGTCNQLRDSLAAARKALPVPDPTSDTALRNGLDAVAVGTDDCIQGARGPVIPQLEKSFSELREAHTLMDVANNTLANWRERPVSLRAPGRRSRR